jgi:hypothetical protein
MPPTYDLDTDAGKVRLLIPDTDTSRPVFSNAEIDAFLELEGTNVRRAAALALDVIASNETQVLKVIQILDLRTDGAALSKELRARAADLRAQADEALDDDDGGFEIAELVVDRTSYLDRIWNQALREDA